MVLSGIHRNPVIQPVSRVFPGTSFVNLPYLRRQPLQTDPRTGSLSHPSPCPHLTSSIRNQQGKSLIIPCRALYFQVLCSFFPNESTHFKSRRTAAIFDPGGRSHIRNRPIKSRVFMSERFGFRNIPVGFRYREERIFKKLKTCKKAHRITLRRYGYKQQIVDNRQHKIRGSVDNPGRVDYFIDN